MNEKQIRDWIARYLKLRKFDDRLWQVLVTFHPDELLAAQAGDEEYLQMLSELSEKYLGALEIFGGTSPFPVRAKLRHAAHNISIEEELRAEAIWDAQVEAAISDSDVARFRQRVLGGKYLTDDEAIAFLNSPAIACLPLDWFQDSGVATYNHQSEVLQGRVDGRPGTDIVIVVHPGDLHSKMTLGLHSRRWDVSELPRWMATGYELYMDHEDSTDDERETNYLWNFYHDPIYELVARSGSVLGELMNQAHDVFERYAFDNLTDLLWIILVGNPVPNLPPKPIEVEIVQVRRSSQASVIRLDVRPWVSADVVSNEYRIAQKQLLGKANRPIQARNLVLFTFVSSRLSDNAPSWPEMATEWNEDLVRMAERNPEWRVDDTWRWTNWRDMYKEYMRVRDKIRKEV
jgi:hypothetical protein